MSSRTIFAMAAIAALLFMIVSAVVLFALATRWRASNSATAIAAASRIESWENFKEEIREVRRGKRKAIWLYLSTDADAKAEELVTLKTLKSLDIHGGSFSNHGMNSVALISGLERFAYAGQGVSDIGIERLRDNTSITDLTLITAPLSPNAADVFHSMPNLNSLTLFAYDSEVCLSANFVELWIKKLSELQGLEKLAIGGEYVGDADVSRLRVSMAPTTVKVLDTPPI